MRSQSNWIQFLEIFKINLSEISKVGYEHELRDFWVGDEYETPKAIEEACRSKCVENIPQGCNAYSVKHGC